MASARKPHIGEDHRDLWAAEQQITADAARGQRAGEPLRGTRAWTAGPNATSRTIRKFAAETEA